MHLIEQNRMNNTIHILGLAPSVQAYQPTKEVVTIGVNDIFKYHKTDILLLMDRIDSFTPDRLNVIMNSKPLETYSNLKEWDFMPGFKKFGLDFRGGYCDNLGKISKMPFHVDSTFTAVCLAYYFGTKEIIMYGVDFYGHSSLMHYEEQILFAYSLLCETLRIKGVSLKIYNCKSLLAQVLPVYK